MAVRKVIIEKDIHDEIMIEIIKYFEASEIWETKGWDYKAVEARNSLGRLKQLAIKRRMEIQEKRNQRPRVKYKKKGDTNE